MSGRATGNVTEVRFMNAQNVVSAKYSIVKIRESPVIRKSASGISYQ